MESLFRDRNWHAMDDHFTSISENLSSRDLYLYANSLWLRKRWEEALNLILSSKELPDELVPYREMLIILGYERTGRKAQALEHALRYFEDAPEELRYYVAYAMARLDEDRQIWYSKMFELAVNKDQKRTALKGILSSPEPDIAYALELIRIEPQNRRALSLLISSGSSEDREVQFSIGYSLYLKGKFQEAFEVLSDVPLEDPDHGLRAGYYRAFCSYRLNRYDEALEIWKAIALNNGEYSSSSARRIAIMAGRFSTEKVLHALEEIARSSGENVRLTALYYLGTLLKGEKSQHYEEMVLREYPSSTYATRFLWKKGWDQWKNKNYQKGLSFWRKALKPGIEGEWHARLLYWIGRSEEKLENDGYRIIYGQLAREYPLSIYTFRAFPDGAWKLSDQVPASMRAGTSLLESWGFMPYALMKAQRDPSPDSILKAAFLASWMGDDHSAFLSAVKVGDNFISDGVMSSEGLKLLYPRPYSDIVKKASRRFSVEPALIWSVMRQESAFDPNATSYVGACGLMQLMPGTASDEAGKLGIDDYDIYDAETNIILGTAHISRLLKKFRRLDWSVAAYNAGSGTLGRWTKGRENDDPEEWVEDIPYVETYGYLKKVLSNLYVYRILYEDKGM